MHLTIKGVVQHSFKVKKFYNEAVTEKNDEIQILDYSYKLK